VEGRDHQGRILKHEFTDEVDVLTMDIKSAYPVKELQRLERTFVYARPGKGSLTVIDDFEFSTPQSFETALITYGTYERTTDSRLELSDHGRTAIVDIQTGGILIEIADEIIGSTKGSPRRIAIRFQKPLKKGQISTKIWPK
jgi:hypothetical protein